MVKNSKNAGLPCGQKNDNKFYIAVDDITHLIGKKDHMKRLYANYQEDILMSDLTEKEKATVKPDDYDIRILTEKFVNNPLTAILNVVYTDPNDSCNPDVQNAFWKRLYFNAKNNCYIFDEYVTLGTHLPPKPIHWERYRKGEYELILIRHEIQVLSTNLESIPLADIKSQLKVADALDESESAAE